MNENYTQAANSRCFGLVDSTLEEIWADIGRTPEDTEAALWKRKLQRIAAQYVLSSRFALMRILCERAGGGETGFTAALEGETLTFTVELCVPLPRPEKPGMEPPGRMATLNLDI